MCLNGTYDWFISIMCNFFTCISQGMQHKGQRMQSELGNKIAKTWNFVMIALINISPNPVPFLWDFPYKGFKEHTKTAGRNICFFVILLWGLIPFLCNIVFILSSSLAENKADIEYRLPACLKITFMFFFTGGCIIHPRRKFPCGCDMGTTSWNLYRQHIERKACRKLY